MSTPRRRPARTAALVTGVLLAAVLATVTPAAGAVAADAEEPGTVVCPAVEQPFAPRALRIPGVVGRTKVLALGRDRQGTPRTPPLTDRGKWQLGWDKKSRIKPGSDHGVIRMNAHTYPHDGTYGLALGNRLLAELRKGDLIVATGRGGDRLCYKVTRIMRVRATKSVPAYYTSAGKPRLAILVCSGKRRGPGDWSHRTIWFASPFTSQTT